MRVEYILVVVAAMLCGLSITMVGRAVAQEGAVADPPSAFDVLDVDGNGYITKREAASMATLQDRFEGLDEDKNNILDRGEFARFETGDQNTDSSQLPEPSDQ